MFEAFAHGRVRLLELEELVEPPPRLLDARASEPVLVDQAALDQVAAEQLGVEILDPAQHRFERVRSDQLEIDQRAAEELRIEIAVRAHAHHGAAAEEDALGLGRFSEIERAGEAALVKREQRLVERELAERELELRSLREVADPLLDRSRCDGSRRDRESHLDVGVDAIEGRADRAAISSVVISSEKRRSISCGSVLSSQRMESSESGRESKLTSLSRPTSLSKRSSTVSSKKLR